MKRVFAAFTRSAFLLAALLAILPAVLLAILLAPTGCAHLMKITTVHTDDAPQAIGPYSQAITLGDLVFCSGQIALDPKSGEMVGDTAAAQAEKVMENMAAVLEAAGTSFDRVVRTTIFLADMNDFTAVNEVYARSFPNHQPARATVAVKQLPMSALVEIDCIASR